MVFQQIKVLVLSIVALFRRALCCFSRKRKPSYSEPMNVVVVNNLPERKVSNNCKYESCIHKSINMFSDKAAVPSEERDWNSWDDSPRSVQEHIEQYRQQIAKPPTTPQTEMNEPDFFKVFSPFLERLECKNN